MVFGVWPSGVFRVQIENIAESQIGTNTWTHAIISRGVSLHTISTIWIISNTLQFHAAKVCKSTHIWWLAIKFYFKFDYSGIFDWGSSYKSHYMAVNLLANKKWFIKWTPIHRIVMELHVIQSYESENCKSWIPLAN